MRLFAEPPASSCVYTIRHLGALRKAESEGGGTWDESKTWRSAAAMLEQSMDKAHGLRSSLRPLTALAVCYTLLVSTASN